MDKLIEQLSSYSVQSKSLAKSLNWVYSKPDSKLIQMGPIVLMPLFIILTQSIYPQRIKKTAKKAFNHLLNILKNNLDIPVTHSPLSVLTYKHLSAKDVLQKEQDNLITHGSSILFLYFLSIQTNSKISIKIDEFDFTLDRSTTPSSIIDYYNTLSQLFLYSFADRSFQLPFYRLLKTCFDLPDRTIKGVRSLAALDYYYYSFFLKLHLVLWVTNYGSSPPLASFRDQIRKVEKYILKELPLLCRRGSDFIEYIAEAIWVLYIINAQRYCNDQTILQYKNVVESWKHSNGSWTTSKSKIVTSYYDYIHPTLNGISIMIEYTK